MEDLSRRNFVKGAAIGATTLSLGGVLAACANNNEPPASSVEKQTDTNDSSAMEPTTIPSAETSSNFDVMPESKTAVGTTYENLLAAIAGETGATTKYEAYAKAASQQGFEDIARLFTCTADAEKIHIELEYNLAKSIDPSTEKPPVPEVETHETDINLMFGANGEIYETSDMYPAFIKAAQAEDNNSAVQVFTRAKLAEGYHAQLYLDAYNSIDVPTQETYYLCPVCGYIHKGENFTACPICLSQKASFTAY